MINDVPASFKTTLCARGLTANSIRLYTYYATTLIEYYGVGARNLQTRDVLEWIPYAQSELGWTPRTVNLALAAHRILFESVGRPSVMAGVRNLHFDHPEPVILSSSEVSVLFASAETVTMRTGIALLYGSGLRISECSPFASATSTARGVFCGSLDRRTATLGTRSCRAPRSTCFGRRGSDDARWVPSRLRARCSSLATASPSADKSWRSNWFAAPSAQASASASTPTCFDTRSRRV
jgi:hypothetical protein